MSATVNAPKLSREDEIVAFFLNQGTDGLFGRTRLMKLLYLADYEARRFIGRPLSAIKYIWYDYGPYDPQLKERIERLKGISVLTEEPIQYPNGRLGYVYTRGSLPVSNSFSAPEVEILSYVWQQYSRVDLRELLDEIVYQTEPMLEAKKNEAKGKPLNMDMVNNTKASELTIPFEELVARSAEVRQGQYLTHADAMAAVLAEPAADAAALATTRLAPYRFTRAPLPTLCCDL